jgi:hypothetical protein
VSFASYGFIQFSNYKKIMPLTSSLFKFFFVVCSVADPDPGSGIRDWVLFDPWIRDPGWEKVSIRIRDPG